ncbi:YegS/Rv2252/BmrU family lipid kinase [Kribbella sp. VKM Ac-2527]|uniref:YegS/Rv2252/BmrU family lipid kinase n=1 Tax=Kribbella caucasensis TaxID=2512215 RepID=A0A4R6IY93_9ACTN|nr:YegS/Rv2252/BmrU family lipid kinase [Kribbella sp. VKM Ac-2527]TDO27812.1 YegS/Rv2252/BmrU family lipid kinase [Kribbella sp. VKM Ac-2527]
MVLPKSEMLDRIRRDRHAVLLVNTKSRRGARHYDEVRALLQDRGFSITAEHAVADPATQLPKLLPEILAERPPLLVVGSGDGTVATVVDHLAYTDTVLGYLPLGTTNNFGRSLGLPLRLEPAVDVIANGKVAEVDLGRVNEDVFANLVSLGISAVVAGRTPHALKRRLGRASYALTSMRALFSHRPFTAEVSSGGVTWRVQTHQLNIANGRTHAGAPIAADASIDDQLLTVYTLGGPSRLSTVAATLRQSLTPHRRLEHKRYLTGTDFTVSTDRPLQVDVDGEITTTTPLHVEVAAGALRVLVPETFPDYKRS